MRRIWAKFWIALDAETITLFQYVLGVAFILAGLYGLFVADQQPPITLRGSMSAHNVALWYGLLAAGPLSCLIGKSLTGSLTYAGHLMQLAGDIMVALALLGYVAGTAEVEQWGSGTVSPFIGGSLFCCALLFLMRDVRRLGAVERKIR